MKKNRRFFPIVLAILAGLVFGAVFSCGGGTSSPSGPSVIPSDTYTGTDEDGKQYELIVTGSEYVLKINGKKVSDGVVSKNGTLWTLMPAGIEGSPNVDFDVTIAGDNIADIGGRIQVWGEPDIIPGVMVPPVPVELAWIWYTMDDSKPNDYLLPANGGAADGAQTIFPPGGASRITNAVDVTNDDGTTGKKPYEYPEDKKPTDKGGNEIPGPVYNFTGNTKVTKDNRGGEEGAQFPLVGWGAKPADDYTLAQLRKARGYSFWVRLNSSTANNWAFLTAVETDFSPEKGYEFKHWFGNQPGDTTYSGKKYKNTTLDLKVGTWYQIKVIMAKDGFNMDQDGWIYQYPPSPTPKNEFNQKAAGQVQWQVPLQHQVGADVSAGGSPYYDIKKGSYDFDLDFYGLELIMK